MSTRITIVRVVRSEWTKLRSLRSTWLTLGVTGLLTVALCAAIGNAVGRGVRAGDPAPSVADAVSVAFLPIDLSVLVIGVFGVLQMSGEYGSGLIRATLTSVPHRWPVLFAKAVVLVAIIGTVMAVVASASFVTCQTLMGAAGASLTDPGVPRAILGAAGCSVLIGLLGLGLGALLRHTAGAIVTLVALLFVVPALLGPVLPGDWEQKVLKFVPTVAGQAMYSLDGSGGPFPAFGPGASAAVLTAWAVLALAGGAAVLRHRDA